MRAQALLVAGQPRSLPSAWDRPLLQNGEAILIGGGGAELGPLVASIQKHFAHAEATSEHKGAGIAGENSHRPLFAARIRRVGTSFALAGAALLGGLMWYLGGVFSLDHLADTFASPGAFIQRAPWWQR